MLSYIASMVVRCMTHGYTKANNMLAWYQRNLIYQAYITPELCCHGLNSAYARKDIITVHFDQL